ncbi:hypothetical protein ACTG2V_17050 [Aeromonas sp. 74A]
MPRTTKLATLLGLLLSAHVVADEREQAYFKQTYQEHYEQMTARLAALHQSAADEQNVIIKDGKRHLAINGLLYPLTADNHILFDLPKPHFFDETAIRNVFDFFDEEWELTWYDGGVVAVNKRFGNYDYGNGCLLEYFPHGQIQNGERTRVVMETSSCSVNSFATSLQYLDKGEELTADQLGLDASLITAVERYQDRLYVSQNGNPGHVAIIDIPSRQQIGEIRGTETGSTRPTTRSVNCLSATTCSTWSRATRTGSISSIWPMNIAMSPPWEPVGIPAATACTAPRPSLPIRITCWWPMR